MLFELGFLVFIAMLSVAVFAPGLGLAAIFAIALEGVAQRVGWVLSRY